MDEFETIAYVVYRADCPSCGGVCDLGDADPEGSHRCEDCGSEFTVTGVGM